MIILIIQEILYYLVGLSYSFLFFYSDYPMLECPLLFFVWTSGN